MPINALKATIKMIDFIRILGGYDIYLVFHQLNKKCLKVSLRSKNNFNVCKFAQKFKGGGHKKASSFCYNTSDLNQGIKEICHSLEQAITSETNLTK